VFGQIAKIMKETCPLLFGDFEESEDGSWVPQYHKV
jgi:hypothetical protein